MEKERVSINIGNTALGSKIKLLSTLSTSLMTLVEDIDRDLRSMRDSEGHRLEFEREQKRMYGNLCKCLKEAAEGCEAKLNGASYWYDKLGIVSNMWKGSHENADEFDVNYTADSAELLQVAMLYTDRAYTMEGYHAIMKFLRGLPSGGRFPDEVINKHQFKKK